MTGADFAFVAAFLKQRSGLIITQDKMYLLETRLAAILRDNNLDSLAALVDVLRQPGAASVKDQVVDAMTTNETSFFRDNHPFDALRKSVIPGLIERRAATRCLRIWSAACSTGQEPYSLAMTLKEMKDKLGGWRVEILGTDISVDVLEKAKAGVYSQFEVQRGLPIQMLVKYFTQTGDTWQISPEIRAMVQYKPLNLLADFAHLGNFDVVFCRNVLIYFDQETKIGVLNRIARMLEPDGFLVLGAAETVVGLTEAFKPMNDKRGLYAPNKDALKVAAGLAKPASIRPLAVVGAR